MDGLAYNTAYIWLNDIVKPNFITFNICNDVGT